MSAKTSNTTNTTTDPEIVELLAAIPPQHDDEAELLDKVRAAGAVIFERNVDWQPAGLVGHAVVAVPVADLIELIRKLPPELRLRADSAARKVGDDYDAKHEGAADQ